MTLKLYNTLTSKLEEFEPINTNMISIYVCGPTVYDYAHIGNGRSVVIYDLLFRILRQIFGSDSVKYVRNITDVDDKIINRAKELNISIDELTKTTTGYFHEHMEYLNCLAPTIEPKATAHIAEMIAMIQKLIDQGFAYVAADHVYFEVSKFQDYTKLSGRKLEEMDAGARIEIDKNKQHPYDFVLWKPAEDVSNMKANFNSPWGVGRPGWHIECSAMSHKYLGENFDIHGGGADLVFPHHTNEIAQSRCTFPDSKFANFWVHNGFLTVNGEKMSKSLGNFVTVKDLIDEDLQGEIIRLFLMSRNYRQPLDYTDKAINDCRKMLNYWYRALEGLNVDRGDEDYLDEEFMNALHDDMNTPLAIKIINDYAKQIYATSSLLQKNQFAKKLITCTNFIGLLNKTPAKWFEIVELSPKINNLLEQRKKAKTEKNWQRADEIRDELLAKNIKIEDHPDGSYTVRKT